MQGLPPRPYPEARLLPETVPAPARSEVWVFEGTLERFVEAPRSYRIRQRVAWPGSASWADAQEMGRWMVARLSINGHLMLGLRARRESEPPHAARLVLAEEHGEGVPFG